MEFTNPDLFTAGTLCTSDVARNRLETKYVYQRRKHGE